MPPHSLAVDKAVLGGDGAVDEEEGAGDPGEKAEDREDGPAHGRGGGVQGGRKVVVSPNASQLSSFPFDSAVFAAERPGFRL